MSTLKAQAEALGIDVNGRWSDETLLKKIAEASKDGVGTQPGSAAPPSPLAASGAPVSDEGDKLKIEATPKAVKSGIPDLSPLVRLTITAQELNIEVDPEWDEDRLRGEIQMAREGRADLQVKGAVPPKEYSDENFDPATKQDKTGTPIVLDYDYWDQNGDRHPAGKEMNLTRDEAKRLIGEGKARRNDPLPG